MEIRGISAGTTVENSQNIESMEAHSARPDTTQQLSSWAVGAGGSNETGSNPTQGAGESTPPGKVGYAEIKAEVDKRLADDPTYARLNEQLKTAESLQADFLSVEAHALCPGDGVLTMADLNAVANDMNNPACAAAQRLLHNPELLAAFMKGDTRASFNDVAEVIKTIRGDVENMRERVTAQVRADLDAKPLVGSGSDPATGAPGAGAPGEVAPTDPKAVEDAKKREEAAKLMAEAGQSLPKPAPSQFSGLEGASENINNMIGWGEQEIDRLTTLMGKTDDPAVLKQLENKINQMSRRMQQLSALMQQTMTMMSNLSKMYSDIAMNSVRNMK